MTPYEFAANPHDALVIMRRYARMFDASPVLDLACGRGHFLTALRERGIEGRGVDISPIAVEYCRQAGFDIVEADVLDYLDGADTVAGAFSAHLVEHLEPPEVERMLLNLARVVRPGGNVVLVTPDPRDFAALSFVFWLDPTHVRFYPIELLGRMLEASGFAIEASGSAPPPFRLRSFLKTLIGKLRFGGRYANGEAWIRAVRC